MPYQILSEAEIREQLGEKAQKVTIIPGPASIEIGVRVGDFAQSTNLTTQMSPDTQKDRVHNLYRDLVDINRRYEMDQKAAGVGNGPRD